MPVLYGVFLFMGVAALKGMQVFKHVIISFMHLQHTFRQTYLFQHQLSSFDTCMPKKWLSQMLFFFQFVDRLALIFMPKKYQPDHMYLRHVPIKRVHLFTLFQIISLAILWVVKMIKSISILFPVMVTFSLDILVYNYKVYDWIWMNIHYFCLKKCLLPSLSFKMLEGVLLL